ncbi:MAG: cytosine permease [Victivallales bacterium]|nr:cytosine permease [Victivallales bacterium]
MSEERDFEQSFVPPEKRRGFWGMFVVMLGFTFFSSSMRTGANIGAGSKLSQFFWAMMAGNLILGVYTSVLAYMASKTGLSVHLLARRAFGKKGSALPSALLAITQIGWFGVGVAMFAFPVLRYCEQKGCHINVWLLVIVAGILMTSSAYWGIKALTIVSIVAVPAIAIGGCFSAIKVFVDDPNAWQTLCSFVPEESKAIPFGMAVSMTIGNFISGGTCTPDFVRFAKNTKIAVSTTAIAFFIGNSLMFIFGAVGAMFFNTNDISDVLVAQGLLVPGIIVLGLNIWTTNDNALYTSGLGIANITGLPKRYIVLVSGLFGTVFAITLYNNFCGYLSLLNNFLPSIGAILAADFFCVRKWWYKDDSVPAAGLPAIFAWLLGTMTAIFIKHGFTAINGMAVAFFSYLLLVKVYLFLNKYYLVLKSIDASLKKLSADKK